MSQIVGGLILGALSDRAMSRRSVLLLSFLGSGISYGTIGLSTSLDMLLMGRVVVGLVKQVRLSVVDLLCQQLEAHTWYYIVV